MNTSSTKNTELSVIIPITERFDPISELFYEYKRGIEATGKTYEFIYVIDGDQPATLEALKKLQPTENHTVIKLAK